MTRHTSLRAALIGEAPPVPAQDLSTAARMRHLAAALDGMDPEAAAAMLAVYAVDRWGRNRGGMMLERAQVKAEGRG